MSDSEMDSEVMQKPVSKKQTRRQKTTSDTEDGKRIFSLTSKSTPKKRKSTSADIFGLSRSVKNDTEKVVSSFSSFFVNKVANGNERRTAVLDGEYVVDLKVYRTSDIVASDSADAWRKALVRIKLQTEEDSDHWKALQRFVLTADKLFEQDPHFYSDRICAK